MEIEKPWVGLGGNMADPWALATDQLQQARVHGLVAWRFLIAVQGQSSVNRHDASGRFRVGGIVP